MEDKQLTKNSAPSPATYKLPIEVWSGIFEKLKSAPETVLNCREVCFDFKNEVDRKMISWVRPSELDPLPVKETPVKKFVPTKIWSRQSTVEFQDDMKNHGGNPFPTRMLSFHPKRCNCNNFCAECLPDFGEVYFRFARFSEQFGMHVHALGVTVVNRSSMGQMKRSVFHNFPNLRKLDVKLAKVERFWRPTKKSFNWLKDFNFPPLPRLTDLKLHFDNLDGELMIMQILKAYGSQIKTLAVTVTRSESASCFEKLTSDVLPNLTNLKIRLPPNYGETEVLSLFSNGNWPLKQLTLFQSGTLFGSAFHLGNVLDVISKFAATLEILHMYIPRHFTPMVSWHSGILFRNLLAVPHNAANERQTEMSVKLSLVKEFSLPYCYTIFTKRFILATRKFCEMAENLETIHVWDDKLSSANYIIPNYEVKLNMGLWSVLSPTSKLKRVIIFSGNEFDENVVVHTVINKPAI